MLALKSLSITAGNNTANSQEDQDPGTVNDGIRDLKAGLAVDYRDREWTEYGRGDGAGTGGTDYSTVYVSASSMTVGAGDVTGAYHAGRAVRITGPSTGTRYGTIVSSSYDAVPDVTTLVLSLDGALLNETGLRIWLSTLSADGRALPIAAINGRAIDMEGEPLTAPTLTDYAEGRATLAISSGTVAWDVADGNVGYLKLTQDVTSIAITGWAGNPKASSLTLIVQQDAAGGRNVSGWPAGIVWLPGSAPVITTAANGVDMVVLISLDGGANIIGNYAQGALFAGAIG